MISTDIDVLLRVNIYCMARFLLILLLITMCRKTVGWKTLASVAQLVECCLID